MKLQTYIQPRRDGTVTVVGEDGQAYLFKADADSTLTCDVGCEATVARLLASGNFEPVDADDFDKAIALSKTGAAQAEQDQEGDEGDFTEEVSPGGLPIEANTPPAAPKKSLKNKTK